MGHIEHPRQIGLSKREIRRAGSDPFDTAVFSALERVMEVGLGRELRDAGWIDTLQNGEIDWQEKNWSLRYRRGDNDDGQG